MERLKKSNTVNRHSRFGGQFTAKLPQREEVVEEDGLTAQGVLPAPSTKPTSIMVQRPFDNDGECHAPQAKLKRAKKNLTFAQEDPYLQIAGMDNKELVGQQACVVAATMADRICVGMGLKQLILRVNEDLRRDEHVVSHELELVYFQVLAVLLRYNRMKLDHEKRLHDRQTNVMPPGQAYSQDEGSSEALSGRKDERGWVPQLQNMIDALDKMTFARVMYAMDKLHKKDKRFTDEHIPIALYKEMICYLRILLDSSNSDHNDIAVATLYRLFYTTSERQVSTVYMQCICSLEAVYVQCMYAYSQRPIITQSICSRFENQSLFSFAVVHPSTPSPSPHPLSPSLHPLTPTSF
jgi:hypothetical protein